ncbi:chromatin assembly factor 1 subunit A-domain-containing protein [Thermothelomyces heterothallicus CBS 202.75]|uniref:chromatin assembly factor 1 subunit A-domain-containing protein n=1 Tax=Thermothelomyces heterothallicus CBS 202.75 TaxID=1149848 RepID=UPI003743EC97
MATDVQDRDVAGRKRSHDDFLTQDSCGAAFRESEDCKADHSLSDKENNVQCAPYGPLASPKAKSSSSLSEPPSSPLNPNSPSPIPSPAPPAPSTGSAQPTSTTGNPTAQKLAGEPPKKKRLTAEEKAAREAEKRKRDEERERKRREKEEADKLKAQQKAAKAEERAAKAADRAEKEQEKRQRAEERERKRREKEEEELRKARSQMKLTSMFRTTTVSKKEPAASNSDQSQATGATAKGGSKEMSLYDQMFKPFFVKEHVRMASQLPELDEETREAKTRILDEYLLGERQHPITTFKPLEALQIPYKVRRGRVYPSVRKIMAEFEGLSSNATGDLSKESQSAQTKHALEALKSVPLKVIQFREDVRPPYVGTISGLPPGVTSLQKLARKPVSKILPLDYEYDSEAEWQEEEGEDVDDLDDDEEEVDMDEDMDDFLDDSEDVGPSRMVFTGGMEPESIGPSWEDKNRTATEPELCKYRLEFVLQSLEHDHSIDPFSTAYWETSKTKANGNAPPTGSTSGTTASNPSSSAQDNARGKPMAPPPAPSDAFQALNSGASAAAPAGNKKSQHPLPPDMQQKLKDLVRSMPTLSKIGVIEFFAANNPGCSKGQIKTSFDALFEKSGKGFKVKGE